MWPTQSGQYALVIAGYTPQDFYDLYYQVGFQIRVGQILANHGERWDPGDIKDDALSLIVFSPRSPRSPWLIHDTQSKSALTKRYDGRLIFMENEGDKK